MLRPGGYWINLGPLLYHWADVTDADGHAADDKRYEQSIEVYRYSYMCTLSLYYPFYCMFIVCSQCM